MNGHVEFLHPPGLLYPQQMGLPSVDCFVNLCLRARLKRDACGLSCPFPLPLPSVLLPALLALPPFPLPLGLLAAF